MNNLASDSSRNTAVFINDFDQEYADALEKLSLKLGRPLRGIILIDKKIKRSGRFAPDRNNIFTQLECDFSDPASLRSRVAEIEDQILLVTCSGEANQPYLRKLLPHVPYVLGPTESSLSWSTHKGQMRSQLASYNPSMVPKFHTVSSADDDEIAKIIDLIDFPMIIKPTGLSASLLVSKVNDEEGLRAALQESFNFAPEVYARMGGRGNPEMIAEEFIEGIMYSVDAYINEDGKTWCLPFVRARTGYAVGYEDFYLYQSDAYNNLSEKQVEDGEAIAAESMKALGLRSCVAHIEMYLTDNGWKIIELGPRAGGMRQDLYWDSFEVDHAYNELLVKVGLEPEINHQQIAYASAVYVYPEEEGIIERVDGLEEAKIKPFVYRLDEKSKAGDTALLSIHGGMMTIRAVLCDPDLKQHEANIEWFRKNIKIVFKDKS